MYIIIIHLNDLMDTKLISKLKAFTDYTKGKCSKGT